MKKNTPEERDRLGETMAANLQAHRGPTQLAGSRPGTLGEAVADAQRLIEASGGLSAAEFEELSDTLDNTMADFLFLGISSGIPVVAEWSNSSTDEKDES